MKFDYDELILVGVTAILSSKKKWSKFRKTLAEIYLTIQRLAATDAELGKLIHLDEDS